MRTRRSARLPVYGTRVKPESFDATQSRETTMKTSNAFKAAGLSLAVVAAASFAQPVSQPASQSMDDVLAAAKKEKPALVETLKELVAFESGSREIDELDRIGAALAGKLRALGGKVEMIEPTEATTTRLSDTPEKLAKMVRATFTGTGTKKILLVAHMDTVYPKGMLAKQPF